MRRAVCYPAHVRVRRHRSTALGAAAAALLFVSPAFAQPGGICDSNAPTSTNACIAQIQSAGGLINDVFRDKLGRTGDQLPLFGQVFDNWPGCDSTSHAGCAGVSNAPYDCPGNYVCQPGVANTIANAGIYANALDHLWWHPCRLANHTLDANGCPIRTCVANGAPGSYFPWEGLVFDLGGPSNQVAVFAENDHGPQPCESVEYTVFLTDNPFAKESIDDPTTLGADPQKWNRAVLDQIFTEGFFTTRAPSPTTAFGPNCGDTAQYSVEDDSFVQVFKLPCGITFRYASIVAGYDGKEFPACAYDSNEGEVDAVAGLTEDGTGVCPDADEDTYVDCACPGAPPVCDCDDTRDTIHPGAPEACDSPDLDCDGLPGACDPGLFCHQSLCVPGCNSGEVGVCPRGSTCTDTDLGTLCVPDDCTTGGCPPGSVCDPATKICRPACEGVVCPPGQVCLGGQCVDPCKNKQCPAPKQCIGGECKAPCSCFGSSVGCDPGLVCDRAAGTCVPPACAGVACSAGQRCDTTGSCVDFCSGVVCPEGQKCVASENGCVDNCSDVTCSSGQSCNPGTGACENDTSCADVVCFSPQVCVNGQCVTPDGGVGAGGSGGAGTDASASGGTSGSGVGGTPSRGGVAAGDPGGCGCRLPSRTGSLGALVGVLGAAAFGLRRRRR